MALGRSDRAREWMRSDPDFDPTHADPRFAAMVEAAERHIASSPAV